jgi:hypothetical protein
MDNEAKRSIGPWETDSLLNESMMATDFKEPKKITSKTIINMSRIMHENPRKTFNYVDNVACRNMNIIETSEYNSQDPFDRKKSMGSTNGSKKNFRINQSSKSRPRSRIKERPLDNSSKFSINDNKSSLNLRRDASSEIVPLGEAKSYLSSHYPTERNQRESPFEFEKYYQSADNNGSSENKAAERRIRPLSSKENQSKGKKFEFANFVRTLCVERQSSNEGNMSKFV